MSCLCLKTDNLFVLFFFSFLFQCTYNNLLNNKVQQVQAAYFCETSKVCSKSCKMSL